MTQIRGVFLQRRFVISNVLLLVIAGVVAAQAPARRQTPLSVALDLTSALDKDSSEFSNHTRIIAEGYWKSGKPELALDQVRALEPAKEFESLSLFASGLTRDNGPEYRQKVFTRALDLLSVGEVRESWGLTSFIGDAIRFGDPDMALQFVGVLERGSARYARSLFSIAEAYAARGQKSKAIELVNTGLEQFMAFDKSESRDVIELKVRAARLLWRLNEAETSRRLLGEARLELLAESEPQRGDEIQIALAYARIGDFPQALALFNTSEDPRELTMLATTYYAMGQESSALSYLAQARQLTESTADRGLRDIAEAYLKLGRLAEAKDVIEGMDYDFDVRECALQLADAFQATGRRVEATATLNAALIKIRSTVSEKSADIPGYASTSRALEKSRDLTELIDKYIEFGELKQAENAALAIDQPQYKSQALARVAGGWARSGDPLKAKSLLREALKLSNTAQPYNHDTSKIYALYEIAEAFADAGAREDAAMAVRHLLKTLEDRDLCCGQSIDELFRVGLMIEEKGIPFDKKSQRVLNELARELEDN